MSLEVLCPEASMGDVAGDLSGRRGQVTGTKSLQPGTLTVNGLAPLSELEGYAATVTSTATDMVCRLPPRSTPLMGLTSS